MRVTNPRVNAVRNSFFCQKTWAKENERNRTDVGGGGKGVGQKGDMPDGKFWTGDPRMRVYLRKGENLKGQPAGGKSPSVMGTK